VEDEIVLTENDLERGFASAYGPRVEVLAIVLSDQRSAQNRLQGEARSDWTVTHR